MARAYNAHIAQMKYEANYPKDTMSRRIQASLLARANECFEQQDPPLFQSSPPGVEESVAIRVNSSKAKLSKNEKRRAQYARRNTKCISSSSQSAETPRNSPHPSNLAVPESASPHLNHLADHESTPPTSTDFSETGNHISLNSTTSTNPNHNSLHLSPNRRTLITVATGQRDPADPGRYLRTSTIRPEVTSPSNSDSPNVDHRNSFTSALTGAPSEDSSTPGQSAEAPRNSPHSSNLAIPESTSPSSDLAGPFSPLGHWIYAIILRCSTAVQDFVNYPTPYRLSHVALKLDEYLACLAEVPRQLKTTSTIFFHRVYPSLLYFYATCYNYYCDFEDHCIDVYFDALSAFYNRYRRLRLFQLNLYFYAQSLYNWML